MLIFSGDINFNPGPVYDSQLSFSNEWDIFKTKGIHLIHLNINSLLPKFDEIRYISASTNVTVSEYLNLSLTKPLFYWKSKSLITSCSDVIGTKMTEVSLAILKVMSVTHKNIFF